jgi:hypothetical protein
MTKADFICNHDELIRNLIALESIRAKCYFNWVTYALVDLSENINSVAKYDHNGDWRNER